MINFKDGIDQYPPLQEWVTDQEINAGDYQEIIEAFHMLFGRSGFRCPGRHYDDGAFTQDDTSYTQVNDESHPDLSTWVGLGVAQRYDEHTSGDKKVDIGLMAVLQDADLKLDVTRIDPDQTTHDLTPTDADAPNVTTNTGSFEQRQSYERFTLDEVSQHGNPDNAPALLKLEVSVKATDASPGSNPAKIMTWLTREADITGVTPYYPADVVAKILFHVHGQTPAFADDFRHSEHPSWLSRYGRHTITKNGDPANADALGDTDGRALDVDQSPSEEYLAASTGSATNPQADTDPFSVLDFFQLAESGEYRLTNDYDGTNGWMTWCDSTDKDYGFFISGSNNNEFIGFDNTSLGDGSPHLGIAVNDPAAPRQIAMYDGSVAETIKQSNFGDTTHSGGLRLYRRKDTNAHFNGVAGLSAYHPQWIPEEVAAYLHECLVTDRTRFAPALDRWVYGTPRGGLQRRIPSYLTDAFGSGGPDFWGNPRRTVLSKDGEAQTQFYNRARQTFLTQRTDADKPTANGDTERGHPLDSIQFSGAEFFDIPSSLLPGTGDFTVFGVSEQVDSPSTGFQRLWGMQGSGSERLLMQENNGQWNPLHDDGSTQDSAIKIGDVTKRTAWAVAFDRSASEIRMTIRDSTGETTQSEAINGTAFSLADGVYGAYTGSNGDQWEGPCEDWGIDLGAALTSSELSSLVQGLANDAGI